MSVRTVTVFATKGKQKAKIETEARVWEQLRPLVEAEGYDLNNLHATESVNRTNLEHTQAVLPEGNFTLFLRPKKTKSGLDVEGLGFKALRQLVKDNGEECKSYLNGIIPGKNWTQLKTDELRDALASFTPGSGTEDAPVVEEVNEGVVEETIEVSEEVVAEVETVEYQNSLERNTAIVELLGEIRDAETEDEEISVFVEDVMDCMSALTEALEAKYSPEAVAQRVAQREEEARIQAEKEEADRLDREETERLEREAEDLMGGF